VGILRISLVLFGTSSFIRICLVLFGTSSGLLYSYGTWFFLIEAPVAEYLGRDAHLKHGIEYVRKTEAWALTHG
jgi:hypothetical protein